MDDQDERNLAGTVTCPNCGTSNTAQDVHCRSCGAWLGGPGQVIDVTSGEPEPVEESQAAHAGWQGHAQTTTFSSGRVKVVRGGNRTCLIIAAIVLLVGCCLCWLLWAGVGSIL
ncbi:MAG TPA: zinc ribbon domain-containing protein [Thermomicrobiales bacterium]|nr:hypothetical protein [Chloroflexota bacterium]HBY45768.1 hypothetical protein [Chloroflexota bacterium]HCG31151.1 hypothetical protein [Chloroflexota bacterium]HQZ89332.1 zinc ribbon domain-containing protein [Thermomicrobiales bacterium]HRA30782.1 zinc ribbon domain-containing protein [Thermomicrobiales bacterium]